MRLVAAAALAALAGCGNPDTQRGQTSFYLEVGNALLARVTGAARGAPAAPALPTRAAIDASEAPVAIVGIEASGQVATVNGIARNGRVTVYSTANAVTVALRDGVLVATRGLGPDLMSAAVPEAAALRRGAGGHRRVHDYLTGTDATRKVALDCTLAPAGTETLSLVGLTVPATVVVETCAGAGGLMVENRYWFDRTGRIRQSRQWIGEAGGYAVIVDPMR